MTQKEYNEEINRLNKIIEELTVKLNNTKYTENTYKQVLEDYYHINEDFRREQIANINNQNKINELSEIIEHYKEIIKRFTFNS